LPFLFTIDLELDSLENISCYLQAHPSVVDQTNQIITGVQHELLLWYRRLGHMGFQLSAAKWHRCKLFDKSAGALNCFAPLRAACQLARQTWHGTSTSMSTKVVTSSHAIHNPHDVFPGSRV